MAGSDGTLTATTERVYLPGGVVVRSLTSGRETTGSQFQSFMDDQACFVRAETQTVVGWTAVFALGPRVVSL